MLALLFALALAPRLTSALLYGQNWYEDGSFTLINFDEGGSCRALLGNFPYSTFVGQQTVAIAAALGAPAPRSSSSETLEGSSSALKPAQANDQARRFCHSEKHLLIARTYSAVLGSFTVVLLALIAAQLFPSYRYLPVTVGALLALSGWHISESMVGTVDSASVFFIHAFLLCSMLAAQRRRFAWVFTLPFLLFAVWTKYWVFALLGMLAFLPPFLWNALSAGLTPSRQLTLLAVLLVSAAVATNSATPAYVSLLLPFSLYLFVPWTSLGRPALVLFALLPIVMILAMQNPLFIAYTTGAETGRFGTDYGAIGKHKYLRNLINVPLVLLVGLGFPGFLALGYAAWLAVLGLFRVGAEEIGQGSRSGRRGLVLNHPYLPLLPLLAFLLYMLALAPVTYYRHYLPLLPMACVFAGWGLLRLPPQVRSGAVALALLWQSALAWDLVSDYHLDPRRMLPALLEREQPEQLLSGFYANPPPAASVSRTLFRVPNLSPESAAKTLDTVWTSHPNALLILSENWYDTALPNELNGPIDDDPRKLIKTRPAAVDFHRRALNDEYPGLSLVEHLKAPTLMPELLLHHRWYGSFTQFVGDLVVLRVDPPTHPESGHKQEHE
ncbi:MAG: hypothetical protein AAF098_08920 [Pseudomonadota bacterium]